MKRLAEGARAYIGVGDQLGPFQRFEEAFKRELSAEPQLSLRLITAAECPALDLIRAGTGEAAGAPRIELTDYRVGRNRPLAGRLANLAGRHAYLVLVDNDGTAYRLDAKPQPGDDFRDVQRSPHPGRRIDRAAAGRPRGRVGEADSGPRDVPLGPAEGARAPSPRRSASRGGRGRGGVFHFRQLTRRERSRPLRRHRSCRRSRPRRRSLFAAARSWFGRYRSRLRRGGRATSKSSVKSGCPPALRWPGYLPRSARACAKPFMLTMNFATAPLTA